MINGINQKNPDNIVPDEKKDELNSIKKNIQDSYDKYKDEITKQTFLLTRKILSSEKYSMIKSISMQKSFVKSSGMWDTSKKIPYSRYSYLKRLVNQVQEYLLKQIDPDSIKDLKIKIVPKSEGPRFFSSGV